MKDLIMNIVREILEKEKAVCFAYFFGSFIDADKYSDIDIGIYLKSLPENPYLITSHLKHKISRKLMAHNIRFRADDIDIVVMNSLPFAFLNRIFREGALIFDKEPELRFNRIEKNSIKMRECLGLIKEAQIL
jgi:predicted nucleotidyltransferase